MAKKASNSINNDFYDDLEEGWYTSFDHPIALLRAENAVRIPWILKEIGAQKKKILDIGCGAGMLTNALSEKGHEVCGIDLSEKSLKTAQKYDATKKVQYLKASADHLPYHNETFDVVCAMDLLEHVENPEKVIQEASRVLKPNGLFFFHTFNRNLLSYFLVIKGVDLFVPNAPKNMHVYPLFIKPKELEKMCENSHLLVQKMLGFVPKIFSRSFLQMALFRKIPQDLQFCFSKSLTTGYCGFAKKILR